MKKQTVKSLALILMLFSFIQEGVTQNFSTEFENYIRSAPTIVEGKVISQRTIREEETGNIFTLSELDISKHFRGGNETTITVKTRGGKFGDRTDKISHAVSLSVGEEVILMLSSVESTSYFIITNGKFGKIRYLNGNRKFHSIYEGNAETFRSKRELIEKIGTLTDNDFNIDPIVTETALSNIIEVGELCFAIANPEPLFQTSQVAFDILIKSETAGLLFSGSEVVLKYPTDNLGSNIALNQNVEVNKAIVSENSEYVLTVEDIAQDQLKIKLGTDCRNKEAYYVLGEEYEKLLRVIVNVQNWGSTPNSSVLNIENFDYEGNAQFFIEERGCVEFEKFCTRGGVHFAVCDVDDIEIIPIAAGIGQMITFTGENFGNGIAGAIAIPNPDDGGASSFSVSGVDFNYIESWSDNEIQLNVSSLGTTSDESPFGSGLWEINPDVTQGTTMACYTNVEIDYALINDNDSGSDRMVALLFNPGVPPVPATYKWYLDLDINTDEVLMERGITFQMVEEVARMVYCDWEAATGIDFEYMGGIAGGVFSEDNLSVVQFNPLPMGMVGNTAARKSQTNCPDDEVFEDRFVEADIELNTNANWFVSLNEDIGENQVDLYSVLSHEVGHAIQLRHSMDTDDANGTEDDRTMFWQLEEEQVKRVIDNRTISGVQLLVERSLEAIDPARCFGGFALATNGGPCTTPVYEVQQSFCNFSLVGNIRSNKNPLRISVEENIDILKIVGISGSIFYETQDLGRGDYEIPTSNFKSGLYFVVFSCGGQFHTQKLLIQ